ncbi:MAG: ATP-binding cassette domain-containing protein, partial [Jannaschia sp.]
MLELDGLRFAQGDFTMTADLALAAGGITALMGASGSGKSTLLSIIAGFLPPTEGRILIDEQDITDLAPGVRPLSILFQDNNLFPHLTLAQNLGLGLRPDLRLSTAQSTARDIMM